MEGIRLVSLRGCPSPPPHNLPELSKECPVIQSYSFRTVVFLLKLFKNINLKLKGLSTVLKLESMRPLRVMKHLPHHIMERGPHGGRVLSPNYPIKLTSPRISIRWLVTSWSLTGELDCAYSLRVLGVHFHCIVGWGE